MNDEETERVIAARKTERENRCTMSETLRRWEKIKPSDNP